MPSEVGQVHRTAFKMHLQRSLVVTGLRQCRQPLQIGGLRFRDAAGEVTTRAPASVLAPKYHAAPDGHYLPARVAYRNQFSEIVFQQRHAPGDMAGRMVDMQRLPLTERDMRLQGDNHPLRRLWRRLRQQPVAAV